jgi:DNA-binding transcriptional ArsR family regulator
MSDPTPASPSPEPITQPTPVVESWWKVVLAWLASGTGRRLLVFLASLVLPVLNKKFEWQLEPEVIVGELVMALGYIAGSNHKEASQARSDALVAASVPSRPS